MKTATKGKKVALRAKCVQCKHRFDLDDKAIAGARDMGAAMCPKCYSPAVVESASIR